MNTFKKIVVSMLNDFGYRMFNLLEKGYILLEVDFSGEKVVHVTSWGYDESKNVNVLYGWVVPCQCYEILDNGKFFIDIMDEFIFGEMDTYCFGTMMDEIAPSLIKTEGNGSKAWYITNKNDMGVSMLGSPVGLTFCREWAKEFGWPQGVE